MVFGLWYIAGFWGTHFSRAKWTKVLEKVFKRSSVVTMPKNRVIPPIFLLTLLRWGFCITSLPLFKGRNRKMWISECPLHHHPKTKVWCVMRNGHWRGWSTFLGRTVAFGTLPLRVWSTRRGHFGVNDFSGFPKVGYMLIPWKVCKTNDFLRDFYGGTPDLR